MKTNHRGVFKDLSIIYMMKFFLEKYLMATSRSLISKQLHHRGLKYASAVRFYKDSWVENYIYRNKPIIDLIMYFIIVYKDWLRNSFLDKSLENNKEQESCCKNISTRGSRVHLLFNIGVQACKFIKKRIQHWCFPVNNAKFLRTTFLIEQLFLIEHPWWLLP